MFYLLFYKNRYLIVFLFLIFIAFLSFFFFSKEEENNFFVKIGENVYFIAYPFFFAFDEIKNSFSYYKRKFFSLDDYLKDVKELKQKLLEKQFYSLEQNLLLQENQKLEEALLYESFLKKNLKVEALFAQIIFRDSKNPYSYLIIDRGLKDNIRFGMPVVAFQFIDSNDKNKKDLAALIVGRIYKSNESFSKVELIFNSQFVMYSQIENTSIFGFLLGQGQVSNLILTHIDPNIYLNINEPYEVISSISDLDFPFGLKIGKIIKELDDHFLDMKSFLIKPYLKLSELEYVFVLKKEQDKELMELLN